MSTLVQTLQQLGIKPFQLQAWLASEQLLPPFRIRAIDRGICRLVGVDRQRDGEALPIPTGDHPSLWPEPYATIDSIPPPNTSLAVGDWVLVQVQQGVHPNIVEVLPRASCVRRGAASGQPGDQLIVSNVDTVLIVSAFGRTAKLLRRGINPRRIERYVAAVRHGGAAAVVVLNKADLGEHVGTVISELSARLAGIDVVGLSAHDPTSLTQLSRYIEPGQTVALLGTSGVGKSTLVNALLGQDLLHTGGVREADTKGKHTTTRRELVRLTSGALLIDTPGMREMALIATDEDTLAFDDINTLARSCRFTDCSHDAEPGCAVRAAITDGRLPAERLQSYSSLSGEALRLQARHDAYARHLQHKEFRRFGRLVKDVSKRRGR